MGKSRSFISIVKASDTLAKIRNYLETRTGDMAIVFIDMVGSTELKKTSQAQWLPIVCRFLLTVSDAIIRQKGRVIKYIGDEVLGVFPEDENGMATTRAENCIWECEAKLKQLGRVYKAKYALDYGRGASVDFPRAPQDILGTCIDRCARIAKIAEAQTAVAPISFVERSKHKASWSLMGQFNFKGLTERVGVYQLQQLGKPISVLDPSLYGVSSRDLINIITDLRKQVEECKKELMVHRTR